MKAVTGLRALPLVAAMCVMNVSLHAQSIYGGLRGSAMDAQGSVIAEAKVTMIDESTSITRSTITNAAGEFNFS